MKQLNLKGMIFGRLTVIEQAETKNQRSMWHCVCSCGAKRIVVGYKLKNGHSKSCGCINKERIAKINPQKKEEKPCDITGCDKKTKSQYCDMHQARFKRNGHFELTRRPNGTGHIGKNGYVDMCIKGRRVYEHVLKAEKALGKRLPKGAVVHHINGDRSDNRNENLVVCPNEKYHRLLHKRQKEAGWG